MRSFTRQVSHIGVPLQGAVTLTEVIQQFAREIAAFGQCRVEDRSSMALAQHKAISVSPSRIVRIMAHDAEVESSHDVGRR